MEWIDIKLRCANIPYHFLRRQIKDKTAHTNISSYLILTGLATFGNFQFHVMDLLTWYLDENECDVKL